MQLSGSDDPVCLGGNLRAETLHGPDVIIHRPEAEPISAREGDGGAAAGGQEGAEKEDGCAHLTGQLVRDLRGLHLCAVYKQGIAVPDGGNPQRVQDLLGQLDIQDFRAVAQDEFPANSRSRGKDRQGVVFGPVDPHRSVQRSAARNLYGVQKNPSFTAYSMHEGGIMCRKIQRPSSRMVWQMRSALSTTAMPCRASVIAARRALSYNRFSAAV